MGARSESLAMKVVRQRRLKAWRLRLNRLRLSRFAFEDAGQGPRFEAVLARVEKLVRKLAS